jgi:hypothetical protein
MKNSLKFIIALGTTLLAGAVLDILYAPDKGERTRRSIVRRSNKAMFNVNDFISIGKDKIDEM